MFLMSAPVRGHACVDKIGVGWGGNNVHFDFYHMVRSLALPHIRNATPLGVLLHFHAYVMLPCWTFSCTSTTTSDNFVLEAGSFQTGLNIKPFKHSFKVLTHMFKRLNIFVGFRRWQHWYWRGRTSVPNNCLKTCSLQPWGCAASDSRWIWRQSSCYCPNQHINCS